MAHVRVLYGHVKCWWDLEASNGDSLESGVYISTQPANSNPKPVSFLFLIVIVQASFSRWKIALSLFVCFQNPIFEFVSWYHFHLSPGVESRWLHLMYTSFNYKMGLSFLLADSSSCKGFLFAYVNYVLLPTPSWKFQTIWFLYITVM